MKRFRLVVARLVALVALAAGLFTLTGATPVQAAELHAAGWWSRTATTNPFAEPPAPLPVPGPTTPDTLPNPTVPEGQLLVEGTPEGATAIAAIHWELLDGESSPSLVLPIGPGSTVQAQSVVLACRAAVAWAPPETRPGRWEAKPVTDSRSCVNGVIADDRSTIGFGLQPLVNGTALDITLVPGRIADGAPAGDGSAFRWVFEDPTPEALTVVASDFDLGANPVLVTVPPTTAPAAAPASAPAPVAAPAPRLPAPTSPPVLTGDSSVVAAPALEATDLGETLPRLPAVASFPTPAATSRPMVGMVLLALGVAAAAWSYFSPASPEAAMIGLGRFRRPVAGAGAPAHGVGAAGDGAVMGGLSRFAKQRSEPPVPIA